MSRRILHANWFRISQEVWVQWYSCEGYYHSSISRILDTDISFDNRRLIYIEFTINQPGWFLSFQNYLILYYKIYIFWDFGGRFNVIVSSYEAQFIIKILGRKWDNSTIYESNLSCTWTLYYAIKCFIFKCVVVLMVPLILDVHQTCYTYKALDDYQICP